MIIFLQVPGIATVCRPGPSLPAAATTIILLSQSFSIAFSRAIRFSFSPNVVAPKDILTILIFKSF